MIMKFTAIPAEVQRLVCLPPLQLQAAVEALSGTDRDHYQHMMERLAEAAAFCAAYMDERIGYGCGDEGHDTAVKAANRARNLVHRGVFGYNTYTPIRF